MKLSIPFYKDYAEAQPKNDFLRLGGNFSKYFVASHIKSPPLPPEN